MNNNNKELNLMRYFLMGVCEGTIRNCILFGTIHVLATIYWLTIGRKK